MNVSNGDRVGRVHLRLLLCALLCMVGSTQRAASDTDGAADGQLDARHIAVIVNDDDPLSRRIAAYYAERRAIPPENVIHVRLDGSRPVLSPDAFGRVYDAVQAHTPRAVQAYVLTWLQPFRVGCMSITTAFAAGFDEGFCARGCKRTRSSPYYDAYSHRPYDDFGWRPAMVLAARDFDAAKALIERGIAADGTHPAGTGYLVSTPDRARNVRARAYPDIIRRQAYRFDLRRVETRSLRDREDVMFYFTGLAVVLGTDTNHYLPGAIADHLTSSGGNLTGGRQMSSLRWLEAGATGSYGTVVEPCAFAQKFPNPAVVISHYLNGDTLIEAYWKSVAWPGQGIFIGEPLAAPFRERVPAVISRQQGAP